ncbi:transposase [Photorhabdus aegyptia]|nr:transposase [Photorhabdus aegyptia]
MSGERIIIFISSKSKIANASWQSFVSKLVYKSEQKGIYLVKLDWWYASSKNRQCCGHKMPEMPLKVRLWSYPACGVAHDRDINAALNIKQKDIDELRVAGLVESFLLTEACVRLVKYEQQPIT